MPRTSSEGATCCHCGEKDPAQFYKTFSTMYSKSEYMPMCKTCLYALFDKLIKRYGDKRKAMQRICMAFDLYYSDSIFDALSLENTSSIIGNYLKKLNMQQHKGKTFDTSLEEGFSFGDMKKKKSTKPQTDEEENISKEDTDRWGFGFGKMDYDILNSHYKLLKSSNPNCDSNQEIFITDLCYTKMQQMKALRDGKVDDYNKLTDSYRKSFTQAGLKTVRDTNINEDFRIGVNAETIEKYTPAEYYKGKELYRDYDNIGEYIERFMLRPLRNLMHGSKDRDYEFYVKEESDDDEYAED